MGWDLKKKMRVCPGGQDGDLQSRGMDVRKGFPLVVQEELPKDLCVDKDFL